MRQETKNIVNAFLAHKSKREARTETDGETIWLHGNKIAWRDSNGAIFATLAGWPTKTTRERLNGLAYKLGTEGFHQTNWTQYFSNKEIGSNDIIQLK